MIRVYKYNIICVYTCVYIYIYIYTHIYIYMCKLLHGSNMCTFLAGMLSKQGSQHIAYPRLDLAAAAERPDRCTVAARPTGLAAF